MREAEAKKKNLPEKIDLGKAPIERRKVAPEQRGDPRPRGCRKH